MLRTSISFLSAPSRSLRLSLLPTACSGAVCIVSLKRGSKLKADFSEFQNQLSNCSENYSSPLYATASLRVILFAKSVKLLNNECCGAGANPRREKNVRSLHACNRRTYPSYELHRRHRHHAAQNQRQHPGDDQRGVCSPWRVHSQVRTEL